MDTNITYIGIDPGWSGGIAWISADGSRYGAEKMPATEADLWGAYLKLDRAFNFTRESDAKATIEKMGSFPPGAASPNTRFKLGWNYGLHRMACIASEFPMDEVTPGKWQGAFSLKGMGMKGTQKKNVHKSKAQLLFPKLKVTHATADALLIAEYARRLEQG